MNIHLARDGGALGIFTESEVRDGLVAGRFLLTDLAWREGMPAWTPLSGWPEFAAAGVAPAPGADDAAAGAPGAVMPAWERGASFASFFATIRDVAIDPVRTFDSLPRQGVAKPLRFSYVAALPGWFCGSVGYGLLFAAMGSLSALLGEPPFKTAPFAEFSPAVGGLVLAAGLACVFLLLPLLHFVTAGMLHILLLPWGPKGGYGMTYRSTAYAQGAFMPFLLIPCLNYAAGPWATVANVIALSRVHRLDWWKVVLSTVVVPCACFCCCYASVLMNIFLRLRK